MTHSLLNHFHALLKKLEATSSKTEKISAIKAALNTRPELGQLFELALSPYITFGVAKLPPDNVLDPLQPDAPPSDWYVVQDTLDRLADRRLTGNEAREQVTHILSLMDHFGEREALKRILLKDLRCGVAATLVNEAVPGTVPVFSCQLAPSEMPALSELRFPIIAEPKYDGVRTIAVKKDGVVTLFSRNGKVFENFVELQNALTALPDNTVLDGEVVSSRGFADLMTRAKAKTGKACDVPIEYWVFDGMRLQDWERQHCSAALLTRQSLTRGWLDYGRIALATPSPQMLCFDVEAVETFYREQLALGLEGIMLKDPNGPYTFKRNKTWLKLKPFDSADLRLVGMIQGTGKYAGMMGALVCEGEHAGKLIKTEVGSGFSDAERLGLWQRRAELSAEPRIAEIRFQEITKAQDSDTYSLRFPSFVRWRTDRALAAE